MAALKSVWFLERCMYARGLNLLRVIHVGSDRHANAVIASPLIVSIL
jgi:hypothetical protein